MNIFSKKEYLPIGIDIGSGYLKVAQLYRADNDLRLVGAAFEKKPADIQSGSSQWQRWAANTLRNMIAKDHFKGRDVVAAVACDDVFIDHIRVESGNPEKLDAVIRDKIRQKLPYEPESAMIMSVQPQLATESAEQDVVVMAVEKVIVERHLAILESAKLEVKCMSVWPMAIVNSFVNFFGRRESDKDQNVVLLEVGTTHTNVVICKHREILFARNIELGLNDFEFEHNQKRLIDEIVACTRYFENAYRNEQITRLVFFSGKIAGPGLCHRIAELAREMRITAQVGDVMAAAKLEAVSYSGFDRRSENPDWTVSFGLSLT